MTTQEILRAAQGAKLPLALADADTKNAALEAMAVALIAAQDKILDANKQDVENARGPMGLAELCTYKYIVHGNGQVRGGSSAKMSCYTNK